VRGGGTVCAVASTTSEAGEKGGLFCAGGGWLGCVCRLSGVMSTLVGTGERH
jgi:hypothetical protein